MYIVSAVVNMSDVLPSLCLSVCGLRVLLPLYQLYCRRPCDRDSLSPYISTTYRWVVMADFDAKKQ